jgi:pilus assembly protein CpaB
MKLRINKALLFPVIALLIGTVAALLANNHIKSTIQAAMPKAATGGTVSVVVATKDLAKGTKLASNLVAVRQVPKDWAHANALTPAQFTQVEGLELIVPAVRGEQLLWAQVEGKKAPTLSARLVSGRRALTVAVDEISSISGMLSPGDIVDLVASVKQQGRSTMVPVLQAVYVLATGTRVEQTGDQPKSYSTVTLDVTPSEAKRIMAAREVGRITALLRASGDRQPGLQGNTDAYTELGLVTASPVQRVGGESVPVIAGRGDPRVYSVGEAAKPPSGSIDEAIARAVATSMVAEQRNAVPITTGPASSDTASRAGSSGVPQGSPAPPQRGGS